MPETIAGYRLLDCVGEGGSGRVYRARNGDGRDVAVKLLAPQFWGHGIASGRIRREIRVLSALSHRNVLSILDHGEHPVVGPYLVTPLIGGRTLRALFAEGPVPPEVIALVFEPLLDGLAALHASGLVHRDIKPENVMLTPDGDVIIMDFGLALHDDQTRCTEEGAVTGSVPYMAPEQVEGRDVSPAADVWSAAVMFYELVTGRRPFERTRRAEEVAAILGGAHEPITEVDRRVSEGLGRLVESALEHDASARPRDGGAMADALRAELDRWMPGERSRDAARAELARDPKAFQERMARERGRALVGEARSALAREGGFAAIKLLDRALAFVPDDAEAAALLDEATRQPADAIAAQSQSQSQSPRRFRYAIAALVAAAACVAVAMLSQHGPPTPPRGATVARPSSPPRPSVPPSPIAPPSPTLPPAVEPPGIVAPAVAPTIPAPTRRVSSRIARAPRMTQPDRTVAGPPPAPAASAPQPHAAATQAPAGIVDRME